MSAPPRWKCWPRSAGPRRCRPARCATRFPGDPFLGFASRSRPTASWRRRSPVGEIAPVTEEEFRRLCDFLYRRTGMVFTRPSAITSSAGSPTHDAPEHRRRSPSYFARLRSDADGEIEQFVNAFTVNETYFYREDHQLRCLTSDLLAERVRGQAAGRGDADLVGALLDGRGALFDRHLAAGELAPGGRPRHRDRRLRHRYPVRWRPRAHGVFGKRALMRLSPELVDKYFVPAGEERWRILDDLRQSVRFTRGQPRRAAPKPGRTACSTSSSAATC